MNFVIRGDFAEICLGPPGKELGCYIPTGVEWRQLNYGQGEGQVEIGGCEWGFYWNNKTELHVVMHDGEMDTEDAVEFARRVAAKLCSQPIALRFKAVRIL